MTKAHIIEAIEAELQATGPTSEPAAINGHGLQHQLHTATSPQSAFVSDRMTKPELMAYAAKHELKVGARWLKADLVEAINDQMKAASHARRKAAIINGSANANGNAFNRLQSLRLHPPGPAPFVTDIMTVADLKAYAETHHLMIKDSQSKTELMLSINTQMKGRSNQPIQCEWVSKPKALNTRSFDKDMRTVSVPKKFLSNGTPRSSSPTDGTVVSLHFESKKTFLTI